MNTPVFKLNRQFLVLYDEYTFARGKVSQNALSMRNLTRGDFKGEMSEKTRSDLRKKLNCYYDCMYSVGAQYRRKKKIHHTILTLTLPAQQVHSDNEVKRSGLMRFVESLKYNFDVRFYYWVAEKQKNQNIHFHILLDRFLPHEWVREKWNERMETMEYITAFEMKNGHRNPNSTDIQTIKNLARSSDYVTKYTSKVEQQGGIKGRLHGECDLLKNFKAYKEELWSEMFTLLNQLEDQGITKVKRLEHCHVVEGDIEKIFKEHAPRTLQRWRDYKFDLCSQLYGN